MHDNERKDRTSASQHKAEVATQKQPTREAFRVVNKNLGDPEKISGAELSRQKPKLAKFAIEDSSRPLFSAKKSLPDPATNLVYQSRPLRLPDYLEEEHKPDTVPHRSPSGSLPAEWDEYPLTPKEIELHEALEKVDMDTFEEILERIAPGNPWAEALLAAGKKAREQS